MAVRLKTRADIEALGLKSSDWADIPEAKKVNEVEETFAAQCRRYRLPPYVRNHKFAKEAYGRLWQMDFAWPDLKFYVEIEGLVPQRLKCISYDKEGNQVITDRMVVMGRHASISGIIEDMVKYNHATKLGWRQLRVPQKWVLNGKRECTTAINETLLTIEAIKHDFRSAP
jgi:very-short-patch-repair endonuclease